MSSGVPQVLNILSKVFIAVYSEKGSYPVSMVYKIQPTAHISYAKLSCYLLGSYNSTSGGKWLYVVGL